MRRGEFIRLERAQAGLALARERDEAEADELRRAARRSVVPAPDARRKAS